MDINIRPNLHLFEPNLRPQKPDKGNFKTPDFNPPVVPDYNPPIIPDYTPNTGDLSIIAKPVNENKTSLVLIMLVAFGLYMVIK